MDKLEVYVKIIKSQPKLGEINTWQYDLNNIPHLKLNLVKQYHMLFMHT